MDVVKKCSAAGYSGVANAVGDRNYPALYPIWGALDAARRGGQERPAEQRPGQLGYSRGTTGAAVDGHTPGRHVAQELRHHGHRRLPRLLPHPAEGLHDVHRQLLSGSRLQAGGPGRPVADFHVGVLPLSADERRKVPRYLWSSFDSGFVGIKSTKYPEVVKDFFAFMSQPSTVPSGARSPRSRARSTSTPEGLADRRQGRSPVEVVLG